MSTENDRYIRLNPDGTSNLVTIKSEPREIAESIIEKFGKDVTRILKRAFPTPNGVAHIIQTDTETFCVARLSRITLLSHYENEKEILTPVFIKDDAPGAKDHPVMPLVWEAPETMVLLFAARILNTTEMNEHPMTHPDQNCYLIAYNSKKQAFLLPLPNLYQDCAICMGRFNGTADSAAQAFVLAMQQFEKSSWNSDLVDSDMTANSKKMFRFKAGEKETTAIPLAGDWTKLCNKVSTPVTELISKLL